MSDSVSNILYIDNHQRVSFEAEAAGPVVAVVAAVIKVATPFLIAAAKSALIGSVVSAGIAYASGARGGDVLNAALRGGLAAGITGGVMHGINGAGLGGAGGSAPPPAATTAVTSGGTNAIGGIGPVNLTPSSSFVATQVGAPMTISDRMLSAIRSFVPTNTSGLDITRIGAALVNAAVNGQSMGQLDGLVAQQRAELEALKQQDAAAYSQRISAAQQILQDADRMDPAWWGRVRMADVAVMEANQHKEAMRNIATKQGGSLDAGQRKAYMRGAALHTARSKAKAYNEGHKDAFLAQNQLRAQGAGLMTGPSLGLWQAGASLEAGAWDARRQLNQDTWGGLLGAFGERNPQPTTSPVPGSDDEDDDSWTSGWTWGGND